MSNLPWIPRINASKVVSVTPAITASSAYSSGLQLGGIMAIADVIRQDSNAGYGTSKLIGVTILDSAKQSSAIDIWLFNQSPTVTSADHDAFAITAANMAAQCLGSVSVGAAYSAAAAVSVSSTSNIGKLLRVAGTVANPSNIYAIAVCRGTPTFGAVNDLQFKFEFALD